MEFEIVVQIKQKAFLMKVKRTYSGESVERFLVSAGGRSLTLRNDRPLLKATGSKKKPSWKIEEGAVPMPAHAFALIVLAIENNVDQIENPKEKYNRK